MSLEDQVEYMEGQLSCFNSLVEKLEFMHGFFDPDPEFTAKARNIVRLNMCTAIKAE